jgi:hypothetical protein
MTMVHERTRSVVQAGEFLRDISKDPSLPDSIRLQAKRLLRHYPAAKDIWLAGKLEERRQEELCLLVDKHGPLHPVLATWSACESMFCDESPQSDSNK